jgi:hypothetical protein
MTRERYDCWQQLVAACRPTEPDTEWATIIPTEDDGVVIVRYPDGSECEMIWHDGQWMTNDAYSSLAE